MNPIMYIKINLMGGLKKSPTNVPLRSLYFLPIYIISALIIGFNCNILVYNPIQSLKAYIYLPVTLLILPSIFEESIFRGLLIPVDTVQKGTKEILFRVALSTILFILWHPLNTIINPISAKFFLDPYFLIIVGLLGIACSTSYIYSKSLWIPILIHWFTVLFWVLFLGGRNLILD